MTQYRIFKYTGLLRHYQARSCRRLRGGLLGLRLRDDASEELQKRSSAVRVPLPNLTDRVFDPAQHDRRVAFERRPSSLSGLGEQRLEG